MKEYIVNNFKAINLQYAVGQLSTCIDLEGCSLKAMMFEKYPSISPYTYCANNPMKFVDPTGKEGDESDDWVKGKDGKMHYNSNVHSQGEAEAAYGKGAHWIKPGSNETQYTSKNGEKVDLGTNGSGRDANYTVNGKQKFAPDEAKNQKQSSSQNSSVNLPDANTSNAVSLVLSAIQESKTTQIAEKAKVANNTFSGIQFAATFQDISKNGWTANNIYNFVKTGVGMCGVPGAVGAIMMDAYKDGGTYFLNTVQQLNQQLPAINNPSNWIP